MSGPESSSDPQRPPRRPRQLSAAVLALVALWAVLGGLWITTPAIAATGPGLGLSVHPASGIPSDYFIVSAHPGQAVRAGSLTITNQTGHALNVRLDPVNGVTDSLLGADYGLAGHTSSESTRWIALSSRRMVIPAHSAREVQVGLLVPR